MLQPETAMASYAVVEVVASRSPGFAPGDRVEGDFGWQDYAVRGPARLRKRDRKAACRAAGGAAAAHGRFRRARSRTPSRGHRGRAGRVTVPELLQRTTEARERQSDSFTLSTRISVIERQVTRLTEQWSIEKRA